MTDCEECIRANQRPLTGIYRNGCTECEARAFAHSPVYAIAAQAEVMTVGYRDALMNAFGEHWRTGHIRVKFWAGRIKEAKGKA
jgi:uncharacterized protein (DUF2237 family)